MSKFEAFVVGRAGPDGAAHLSGGVAGHDYGTARWLLERPWLPVGVDGFGHEGAGGGEHGKAKIALVWRGRRHEIGLHRLEQMVSRLADLRAFRMLAQDEHQQDLGAKHAPRQLYVQLVERVFRFVGHVVSRVWRGQ